MGFHTAIFLLFTCFISAIAEVSAGQPVEQTTPKWIWKTAIPGADDQIYFRRELQLPPEIVSASITICCDDSQRVFVNGREVGASKDWKSPQTYDVVALLKGGGKNLIAVEGKNAGGSAGLALVFRATLKDGKKLNVVTDGNWVCSSVLMNGWQTSDINGSEWVPATVIAKMGDTPWGDLIPAENLDAVSVPPKMHTDQGQ